MRVVVVTGTGTGIGKTVVTAAIAACALRAGMSVAVLKPVQTGVEPGEPGDLAEVTRLTGLTDVHEYARFAEPLAPATAARRVSQPGPSIAELVEWIHELADRELVIIEGAGGALVRLNEDRDTMIDLISELQDIAAKVEIVLVTGAGLGALHDAGSTAMAIGNWVGGPDHLVVGDWPERPGLAERCNLTDLEAYTEALIEGVLPHGLGKLSARDFGPAAMAWLTPTLGGTFDAREFIQIETETRVQKASRS